MASRICIPLLLLAFEPVAALWPAPQSYTSGNTSLFIKENIAITINGGGSVRWLPNSKSAILVQGPHTKNGPRVQQVFQADFAPSGFDTKDIVNAGISRALGSIFTADFVPWMLKPRNSLSNFEPAANATVGLVSSLEITVPEDSITTAQFSQDESYNLTVGECGTAKLSALSSTGILRGLQTFSQLFYQHSSGDAWYMVNAPIDIQDSPKYSHRGVLLDTSRHFIPVTDITKTINAMSWNKMNILHVHVTDSQSWPLEVPALPELTAKGAYSPASIYSVDDIQSIQEYGAYRGVEVYFEIDTPGHIGVVGEAFPELVSAYDAYPYFYYCAQPPCGALRLNNSNVEDFLDTLLGDVLPRVSPYSRYFHTGGDEYNANSSLLDPGLETGNATLLQPFVQSFVDNTHKRVRSAGLTPMVWEEMSTTWNVTLGEDVVVQSWLGGTAVADLTALGHKVISSDYNYWYLDCGRGQWLTFENGVTFDTYSGTGFADWCGPTKSWQLVYTYDPAGGLNGTQAELVLGGEVAVWSETIDPTNLDSLLWPRGAAAAEVLWSGRTDASGQNRSLVEASVRLNEQRSRMVALGVAAAPIQMEWCLQYGSGKGCQYPDV